MTTDTIPKIDWYEGLQNEPTIARPMALRSGLTASIARYESDNRPMALELVGVDNEGRPFRLRLGYEITQLVPFLVAFAPYDCEVSLAALRELDGSAR